jgi:hypothetical protein
MSQERFLTSGVCSVGGGEVLVHGHAPGGMCEGTAEAVSACGWEAGIGRDFFCFSGGRDLG